MFNHRSPGIFRSIQSYRIGYVVLRLITVSLIAVGVLHLISAVVPKPENYDGPFVIHYVVIISVFNLVSEVQVLLDHILEKFLPVPKNYKIRLGIQLGAGIILLVVFHQLTMLVLSPEFGAPQSRAGVFLGLMFGLLFIYMLANSLIYTRFLEKWVESQNKIEEMEREKLQMDYNSLQNQLNPHFLFNNLSVLKSLITYDQGTALEFVENFTDVYRYVLQCKDRQLVNLKEELDFIHSYIALHKERLGNGLDVKISVLKEDLNKGIAPLTLQLLVENAIKHNTARSEKPLQIDISTENGLICVANTLQVRNSTYSTKTGLRNLVKRYEMLSPHEIEVSKSDEEFRVKVPLL